MKQTEFVSKYAEHSAFTALLNCAEVGVKQSGDRLFQLNNWKCRLVDEIEFLRNYRLLSHSLLWTYLANFALAASAKAAKAAASLTAKSASILRFTSISANFKPCINCE